MNFSFIFQLALKSIRGNLLRAVLTLSIIAIGIMALIGILTAIDGIKTSISTNFASLGANNFQIIQKGSGIQIGHGGRRAKPSPPLTFDQVESFKEQYHFPASASISTQVAFTAVVKSAIAETNPNIMVFGIDENYGKVAGLEIGHGRNFTAFDAENGQDIALIGETIAQKLFLKPQLALDSLVLINSKRYKVVGVLKSKGSSGIFNSDNTVYIPLNSARQHFSTAQSTFNLTVAVDNSYDMETAMSEAEATMRKVRHLALNEANDFEFSSSDKLSSILIEQLGSVVLAAYFIGIITLLGAGIGLMNIMLVSVAERTREVGISKALGAKNKDILLQFLGEAIVICQIGGILGIILGIIVGNLVSTLVNGPFIIPWAWILGGIVFCIIIGVAAGIYPALKAARLDPIESLRYE
ncbi:MAG: ABC transporter permease [Chitinophagales bacterium]|nr:ABC transporter permease [Bacteroidota bacterium]MCB9043200.1 ABC transporter permease [Chitinophagales bacterium]